ncbi:hypothetical protein LCGC14_0165120 [marine sediment metagenome]|uniref:Uncharacterized protein n=1 Tax=marine sediment metagenome TaxID=412755 RepID=A0A0F9XWS1_9ZZZZ
MLKQEAVAFPDIDEADFKGSSMFERTGDGPIKIY